MISTPFGATWEDLDLDGLRTFFAEAGDEGLTWEAKGRDIHPGQIRKAASAFGNSVLGGYLVLGAWREKGSTGRWTLDGFVSPDEPQTWVSNCLLNDGVRPRPSFDTKAWQTDEGRDVVVVSFQPVAVPPVVTRDGQVWERLSGMSVQVKEPASMRSLLARGEVATAEAQRLSEDGREAIWTGPPLGRVYTIVLSMASPALIGDVSPFVFRRSVYDAAVSVLNDALELQSVRGLRRSGVDGEISQHALTLWNWGLRGEGRCLQIGRHGSIAVGTSDKLVESGLDSVAGSTRELAQLWAGASSLMTFLVSEAPVHVAIGLTHPDPASNTRLARWSSVPGPLDEDLAAIQRETRRARGEPEYEPEPG